jgi:hypothetical protein
MELRAVPLARLYDQHAEECAPPSRPRTPSAAPCSSSSPPNGDATPISYASKRGRIKAPLHMRQCRGPQPLPAHPQLRGAHHAQRGQPAQGWQWSQPSARAQAASDAEGPPPVQGRFSKFWQMSPLSRKAPDERCGHAPSAQSCGAHLGACNKDDQGGGRQ